MIATIVSGGFKAFIWGLAATGLVTLILAGLIAWPLRPLPELTSISAARKSIDFSTLPDASRFQARDGTELAYRHYAAQAPANGVANTDRRRAVAGHSSASLASRDKAASTSSNKQRLTTGLLLLSSKARCAARAMSRCS